MAPSSLESRLHARRNCGVLELQTLYRKMRLQEMIKGPWRLVTRSGFHSRIALRREMDERGPRQWPARHLYHGGVRRERHNNEDASGIANGVFVVRQRVD